MYRFGFYRMARTTQAALKCGADIEHLSELGRRYWLVLSCPVNTTPALNDVAPLLDTDKDGRVRIPEVLAAVEWLKPRLSSFDVLFTEAEGLAASDIRQDTEEGAVLNKLFTSLSDGSALSERTLAEAIASFKAGAANGDSVIPASAIDAKFSTVAEAILAVTGGTPACDGSNGISEANLEAFAAARDAYLAWKLAKPEFGDTLNGIAPDDAVACVESIAAKIEAFFSSCELVRYNPAAKDAFILPTTTEALPDALLALPTPDVKGLPLTHGVNPAWAGSLAQLAKLLDEETLTPELWLKAKERVAPFKAWAASKPSGADIFAGMDEHILEMSGDDNVKRIIKEAIAADAANAPLAAAFEDLKRLTVLRLGFLRFLRNFVNVEDLYPPVAKPLFLTGTLYMDERACSLCFPIEKAAAAHASTAANSKCCLVYCTLSRPAENRTRTILAVFTSGTIGNLTTGKRGIFFDLEGKDWEATVCHVVPNAISLTEAFFAPWRKVGEAIAGTIHKFVAGKNDAATAAITTKATTATTAATSGTAPVSGANNGAMMASVATLGIALSFVASAVAGIASALTSTPLWKTALVVLGIICVVSVPSVILTWLKLRARDLAPILNASDWAINRSIGFTARIGAFFTQKASYVGKRFVCPPMRHRLSWAHVLLILTILLLVIGISGWFFCPLSPRNQAKAESKASSCCAAVQPETPAPESETPATPEKTSLPQTPSGLPE